AWVERETRRVVARRGDLVIAETRHGFVCANAGVDASNVEEGFLTLLPEDPDASAEQPRSVLGERLGLEPAVVITDTFGRTWRRGLVNVSIGCAGIPALVDLRGTAAHHGRELGAPGGGAASGPSPTGCPPRAGSRGARRRGCRSRSSGASGSSRHRYRRPRWSAR